MTVEITDDVLLGFGEEVGADGPVAVAGARTRWTAGGALADDTRVVAAPAGIVAHNPGEMTVRVRAGTPVADLHAELAGSGQRTALPDRGGTVGGAIAVGEDDVRVAGVGRVRDALLQVRYVTADGAVATGGGPTVKNVSGYDLPRLLVGSLGTLGLVGEVLLRTNPVPTRSTWVAADDVDPLRVADALYHPAAVLWDRARTWVLLEGHPPDVDHERDVLATHGDFESVDGPPQLPPHRWALARTALHDLPDDLDDAEVVVSVWTGTVFASRTQPSDPRDEALVALAGRVKDAFDPDGRFAPGRDPWLR